MNINYPKELMRISYKQLMNMSQVVALSYIKQSHKCLCI